MPNPEWFNENSYRAYPFYKGIFANQISASGGQGLETASNDAHTLLNCWIIDASFFLTDDSFFDAKTNSVNLVRIVSNGLGVVTFYFQLDSWPIYFVFSADLSGNLEAQNFSVFSPTFTKTEDDISILDFLALKNQTYIKPPFTSLNLVSNYSSGYGVITVGKLQTGPLLNTALSLRPTTHCLIEPALIQVSTKSRITSINVGNTVPLDLPACDDVDPTVTVVNDVDVVGTAVYGDISLIPGYNTVIRINESINTVEISAEPGAGMGCPCGKFEDEDTDCDELINSINGVPPDDRGDFSIIGGSGVKIENIPAEHKIRIHTTADNLLCGSGV